MIIENPENYEFIKFVKSHLPNKKYNAVLLNKKTGKFKNVPFGSTSYQHFQDTTGLNLYSHLDHLDTSRRRLYRLRHKGEDKNKFSSGFFAYRYLW